MAVGKRMAILRDIMRLGSQATPYAVVHGCADPRCNPSSAATAGGEVPVQPARPHVRAREEKEQAAT
jgi:hypothetical protein